MPARRRPNLAVLTDTRATRLCFEGRRCVGVEVLRGRRAGHGARPSRGHPCCRRGGFAAAAAAVGHRARIAAAIAATAARCRSSRRRRQPAGSSAAAHGVQGQRGAHAEYAGRQSARQTGDGAAVRLHAPRTADDESEPAWRVRALELGASASERRISRAAALAGSLRRAAASVPRVHGVGVQPAADLARNRATPRCRSAGAARHCAALPNDRGRSPCRRPTPCG